MTKKVSEFTKQVDRVEKVLDEWKWIIKHLGWKYTVIYCENSDGMPDWLEKERAGCAHTQPEYMKGVMYFNMNLCRYLDDEDLEAYILHELTHFLVAPLAEDGSRLEYVVTTISRIFSTIQDMGMK